VLVGAALCLLPLAWAAALLAHHLVFYGLARTATRALSERDAARLGLDVRPASPGAAFWLQT
jgi:hypothetical protein